VMWGGNTRHRFEGLYDSSRGSDDVLLLWTTTRGAILMRTLGQELLLGDGLATTVSCADKTVAENLSTLRHINLKVSRALLQPLLKDVDEAFMRPIPAASEGLRLLKSYLELFRNDRSVGGAEIERLIAQHIADLVAVAIGATREGAEIAQERGVRAARLNAIKRLVLERFGDPGFSVSEAALSQGVTPRTVQLLFEGEGTTFSQFLLGERLKAAYRSVSDARQASSSISTVALNAGFGDLSYFNRAFRRAFGETPSDVRRRALQGLV
jgi:AraC-like DNA-binding protein